MARHPPLDTFSIATTEANELMDPIHDRMPVILHSRDFDRWLNNYTARPAPPLRIRWHAHDASQSNCLDVKSSRGCVVLHRLNSAATLTQRTTTEAP
jgi:putative SOS response-associated peptidase YedK